ncbi:MAG: 1-acyl-sn-glycerol-3-phosphate acyltransferase [Candidatus Cryptobacteroides sp.]
MNRLFLKIYDFLSSHRTATWIILVVAMAVSILSLTRMKYSEDISAFLPKNELTEKYSSVYMKLGGQDRIAVFFRGDDRDSIMCAMDLFGERWTERDTAGIVTDLQVRMEDDAIGTVTDFVRNNIPYFLEKQDYERMDSLLAEPGYIQDRLEQDIRMMMFPTSSMVGEYISYDPLDLFSPVYKRLSSLDTGSASMDDGYVFLGDGVGTVFMKSPYGDSESGNNARIVNMLDEVIESVSETFPSVSVSSVGGPVIAVGNSSRIKKDSILAVAISIILIFTVLLLSFRDFRDILWIGFSILCGCIFSLGLISLFKTEISLIILGISSIIIGIAVNYPLHYIDHLKHQPDRRAALKDVVSPLLTGNITTVLAFLSMYLLKAEALHDFGLAGALVLVGTILFVLVFLPVISGKSGPRRPAAVDFGRIVPERVPGWLFWPFLAVTVILAIFSSRAEFDSDMRNINYMTDTQREDLALLASASGTAGHTKIWAVSEGEDMESALQRNEEFLNEIGDGWSVSSISSLVPSMRRQEDKLRMWEDFLAGHPSLGSMVAESASKAGFSDSAFTNFSNVLGGTYPLRDAGWFAPLFETVGQASVIDSEDGVEVVNYIMVPSEDAAEAKAAIASRIGGDSFVFDSTDVSGNLATLLSEDFNNIGLVCGFIVFFFLWLSFGRIELSLMSFLPLAVSWVWILGIMHISGLQFNIVNIILATFIFGQGDDYTIFITEGLMYEYAYGKKILSSYRNSIALSAIIMFIGIGTLIVAQHPAMKSLAQVTIIGMFTVVLMACCLPPIVFRALAYKNGKPREMPLTLKRLARSLWAITFFLLAAAVIVPATKLYFLIGKRTEKKVHRYHVFLQRLSGFIIHRVPGVRFSLDNSIGETFEKPGVIVCNHQSHLDVMCLMMLSPNIVILTNDWVWNNPFYKGIIRHAEFYPVSDGIDTNLERIRNLVARGYSVVVFPEGTRSADCSIRRFHKGAFHISKELGLDIIPIILHGAGDVLPKEDFMLRPGRIDVKVCERMCVDEMGGDARLAAKSFRKFYQAEYGRMSREIEKGGYFVELVRHSFLYKGKDVERAACRELAGADIASVEAAESGSCVRVDSGESGAYALLFALTRKDVTVVVEGAGEEVGDLLRNCAVRPGNLVLEGD